MNETLIERTPMEFKNKLPVNAFFVTGKTIEPVKKVHLSFAVSNFYVTKKMRCNNFYKPAFI